MSIYGIILCAIAGYMALSVRIVGHYAVARIFKMSVHYVQFGRGPLVAETNLPGDRAACGFMLYPWCGDISVDYRRHHWVDKVTFHMGGTLGNLASALMGVALLPFLSWVLGNPPLTNLWLFPDDPLLVPMQLLIVFVRANLYAFAFSFLPLPGTHTWEAIRVCVRQYFPRMVGTMDRYAYRMLQGMLVVMIICIIQNPYE